MCDSNNPYFYCLTEFRRGQYAHESRVSNHGGINRHRTGPTRERRLAYQEAAVSWDRHRNLRGRKPSTALSEQRCTQRREEVKGKEGMEAGWKRDRGLQMLHLLLIIFLQLPASPMSRTPPGAHRCQGTMAGSNAEWDNITAEDIHSEG